MIYPGHKLIQCKGRFICCSKAFLLIWFLSNADSSKAERHKIQKGKQLKMFPQQNWVSVVVWVRWGSRDRAIAITMRSTDPHPLHSIYSIGRPFILPSF